MKTIITVCLFIVYTGGSCFNTVHPIKKIAPALGYAETSNFLTSKIEGNQLYLNIPENLLDQPMLFVRYDKSFNSKYIQVVWSLHEAKILLKVNNIHSTAGIILPLKPKLALADNILATFPIEKKPAEDGGYRIDITEFILTHDIEWNPGFTESIASDISLLLGSKNMDREVIIKIRKGIMMDQYKTALPLYLSFCALKEPMKGRRYDFRMGFFNEKLLDIPYGVENFPANIGRWRLEKEDEKKELSKPKTPITFIISPEVPKKWRPTVKAGIEQWLPAFEAAGFREALVVKEVDSLGEWEAHSINTSVVYWGDSIRLRGLEQGGFGGTVSNIVDERTGEILKGDIYMAISRDEYSERYFVRSAPLDKRAQKFPFPEDLMGELYQTMVAHEVGHVFGLMDDNFGKFSYSIDQIRNVDWLESMGHTPSVMNYTRSNNIAQPEDRIPPSLLMQKVGPIDHYGIRWAYTEFPSDFSPDQEEAALERIIREQDSVPWYRFNYGAYEAIGPAVVNEVVVSRNPMENTKLALKNIKRVLELLPEVCSDQKDNARLERLYARLLVLWFDQMMYVSSLIGGYELQYKSINQTGNSYTPIPLETQVEALDFLFKNAFDPPEWLVSPKFERKIKYSTYPDQMLAYQQELMFELLEVKRTKRFEYLESIMEHEDVLHHYLTRLQDGLFRGLNDSSVLIKPRHQEIQMTYIEKMVSIVQQKRQTINAIDKAFAYTDYTKGLAMEQLEMLKEMVQKKLKHKHGNRYLGHWQLCLEKLNEIGI